MTDAQPLDPAAAIAQTLKELKDQNALIRKSNADERTAQKERLQNDQAERAKRESGASFASERSTFNHHRLFCGNALDSTIPVQQNKWFARTGK